MGSSSLPLWWRDDAGCWSFPVYRPIACYDGGLDQRTRARAQEYLLKQSTKDPAFRAALMRDPRAAIKETFGLDLPPDLEPRVFEDTPTAWHVVLPLPPPSRDAVVTLREITMENAGSVINLEVKETQRSLVATNAVSLAQMHFEPKAWA